MWHLLDGLTFLRLCQRAEACRLPLGHSPDDIIDEAYDRVVVPTVHGNGALVDHVSEKQHRYPYGVAHLLEVGMLPCCQRTWNLRPSQLILLNIGANRGRSMADRSSGVFFKYLDELLLLPAT